jgi:hypothetical protein
VKENFADEDVQFFRQNPKRHLHIRRARPGERAADFATLGFHLVERRRIIAWKVPDEARKAAGEIILIPFLQFADETIPDTDAFLAPILHQIMLDARQEYGGKMPKFSLVKALTE